MVLFLYEHEHMGRFQICISVPLGFRKKKFLRNNRVDLRVLVLNKVYLVIPLADKK